MAPPKHYQAAMATIDFMRAHRENDKVSINGPEIYNLFLREHPYDRVCYLLRGKDLKFNQDDLAQHLATAVPELDLHQEGEETSQPSPTSMPEPSPARQQRLQVTPASEPRSDTTPEEQYFVDKLAELPFDFTRFVDSKAKQILKMVILPEAEQSSSLKTCLDLWGSLCKSVDNDLCADNNFRYDETNGFTVLIPQDNARLKYKRASLQNLQELLIQEVKWLKTKLRRSKIQPRHRKDNRELCWWVAQAIHYGISVGLHVEDIKASMQKAIVDGTLAVPERLVKLRRKLMAKSEGRAWDSNASSDDEPSVKHDSDSEEERKKRRAKARASKKTGSKRSRREPSSKSDNTSDGNNEQHGTGAWEDEVVTESVEHEADIYDLPMSDAEEGDDEDDDAEDDQSDEEVNDEEVDEDAHHDNDESGEEGQESDAEQQENEEDSSEDEDSSDEQNTSSDDSSWKRSTAADDIDNDGLLGFDDVGNTARESDDEVLDPEELAWQVRLADSAIGAHDFNFFHRNQNNNSTPPTQTIVPSRPRPTGQPSHLSNAYNQDRFNSSSSTNLRVKVRQTSHQQRSMDRANRADHDGVLSCNDSHTHDSLASSSPTLAVLQRSGRQSLTGSARVTPSNAKLPRMRKDAPGVGLDQAFRGKRFSKSQEQNDSHDSNMNSDPSSSDSLLTGLEKTLDQDIDDDDEDESEAQLHQDLAAASSPANRLSSSKKALFKRVPAQERVPGIPSGDDLVPTVDAPKKKVVRRFVPDDSVSPPPFHPMPPFHVSRQKKAPLSFPAVTRQSTPATKITFRIPSYTPAKAPPGFVAQAHPDLGRKTSEFLSHLPRMLVNDRELHYYLEQHHYNLDAALNAFVEDNDMLVVEAESVDEEVEDNGDREDENGLEAARVLSTGGHEGGDKLSKAGDDSRNPKPSRAASRQNLHPVNPIRSDSAQQGMEKLRGQAAAARSSNIPLKPGRSPLVAAAPASKASAKPSASAPYSDGIKVAKSGAPVSIYSSRRTASDQTLKNDTRKSTAAVDITDNWKASDSSGRGLDKPDQSFEKGPAPKSKRKLMGQMLPPIVANDTHSTNINDGSHKTRPTDTVTSATQLAQKRKADDMLGKFSARKHVEVEGLSNKKAREMLNKPERAVEARLAPDEADTHAERPSITRLTPIPTSGEDRRQWMKLQQRIRSDPEANPAFSTPFPADSARSNRRMGLYDGHIVAQLSRGKDDAPIQPDPLIRDLVKPRPLTETLYSVNGVPTAKETAESCTNAFKPAGEFLGAKTPAGETLRLHLQHESRRLNTKLINSWPPKPPPTAVPRTQAWVAAQAEPSKEALKAVKGSFFVSTPPSTVYSTLKFRHSDLRTFDLDDSSPRLDVITKTMTGSVEKRSRSMLPPGHSKDDETTSIEAEVPSENVNAPETSKSKLSSVRATALHSSGPHTDKHSKISERRKEISNFEENVGRATTVSDKGVVENATEKVKSKSSRVTRNLGNNGAFPVSTKKSDVDSSDTSSDSSSDGSSDGSSGDGSPNSSDDGSTDDSDGDDDDGVVGSGPSFNRELTTSRPTKRAAGDGPRIQGSVQNQRAATDSQPSSWSGMTRTSSHRDERRLANLNSPPVTGETVSRNHERRLSLRTLPAIPAAIRRVTYQADAVGTPEPNEDGLSIPPPTASKRGLDLEKPRAPQIEMTRPFTAAVDGADPESTSNQDQAVKRKRKRPTISFEESEAKTEVAQLESEPESKLRKKRKRSKTLYEDVETALAADEEGLEEEVDQPQDDFAAQLEAQEKFWGKQMRRMKWWRKARGHYARPVDMAQELMNEERLRRANGEARRIYRTAALEKIASLKNSNEVAHGETSQDSAADEAVQPPNNATSEWDEEFTRHMAINGYMLQMQDTAVSSGFWNPHWEEHMRKALQGKLKRGHKFCRRFVYARNNLMRWARSDLAPEKGHWGSETRSEYDRQWTKERVRLECEFDQKYEDNNDEDGVRDGDEEE